MGLRNLFMSERERKKRNLEEYIANKEQTDPREYIALINNGEGPQLLRALDAVYYPAIVDNIANICERKNVEPIQPTDLIPFGPTQLVSPIWFEDICQIPDAHKRRDELNLEIIAYAKKRAHNIFQADYFCLGYFIDLGKLKLGDGTIYFKLNALVQFYLKNQSIS